MQVRPGCVAGLPDTADHLAGFDTCTNIHIRRNTAALHVAILIRAAVITDNYNTGTKAIAVVLTTRMMLRAVAHILHRSAHSGNNGCTGNAAVGNINTIVVFIGVIIIKPLRQIFMPGNRPYQRCCQRGSWQQTDDHQDCQHKT